MNTRQVIALIQAAAEPISEATPDCLQPELLAAYHDGNLHHRERAVAEAHLVVCDRCLGQLGALSCAKTGQSLEPDVPPHLIARAEALFAPPVPAKVPLQWRWAIPLAAAAGLILAVNLALLTPSILNHEAGESPTPQTRIAHGELQLPRLLVPAEGSVVWPPEQEFRWTEVPNALFYDVRLIKLDGELLLRERVDKTQWMIPASLRLEPGMEYFVRVDAYLDDARYLSSQHRLFRVKGRTQ